LLTPEDSVRSQHWSSLLIAKTIKKIADTSCILAWLIEQGYEVYAFMADVGQEEVLLKSLRIVRIAY
jgi:Arginosuccinate synthase